MLEMHQPNGGHEHRASKTLAQPDNSDDGLSTKVCHCGMIRHMNADGGPVAA